MSETKWTPGPWEVEEIMPEDKDWGMCEITASDDSFVATAVIGLANARLISAAPDMAEALQGFLDHYVAMVNSGDWGFWNPEDEPPVKVACAALAKARGEA